MISGLIIVVLAFSFSTFLALNDKEVVASIIAGTTLVSIFTNLIINTRVKTINDEKNDNMQSEDNNNQSNDNEE
ncbi:hypothetical protein HZY88_05995 [Aerococcaceae bacterium DSM 111176]|nr:hypothetical protein [Aerococcaceae bacterium DSM 111176]